MRPKQIMLIAGEPSGDALAAELVSLLRPAIAHRDSRPSADLQPLTTGLEAAFFGAGGPKMAAAGVKIMLDLTSRAIVGIWEAVKHYREFRRFFKQLLDLAIEREPDAIILVDYPGFNLRFAGAVKDYLRSRRRMFNNWNPKIVFYVSPQIWAWHESRLRQMSRDIDLLLSIFPFEKQWYAERNPRFRVEFVGHPLIDRYPGQQMRARPAPAPQSAGAQEKPIPLVVLLPGSRQRELKKHLPVMLRAAQQLQRQLAARFRIVLPNESLAALARASVPSQLELTVQSGALAESLRDADLAIAASGTVTVECAYFGVPTVVIYITSWSTYLLGKIFIKVRFLAMPNLLAGEEIYPELIQNDATPTKIADATLHFLRSPNARQSVQVKLEKVIASLGPPGAAQRAAQAILRLL